MIKMAAKLTLCLLGVIAMIPVIALGVVLSSPLYAVLGGLCAGLFLAMAYLTIFG